MNETTKKQPYKGPKPGGGPYKSKGTAKSKCSKFAQKGKGKPKKSVAPLKRGEPVYLYLCECHSERANKKPCERTAEDRAEKKFSTSSLGSWNCSVSRKPCKVSRRLNKPVEELAAAA